MKKPQTFYEIHINSERGNTGMTAEALGISVAPSFFHTCVSEGKIAKPEEVQKFKVYFHEFFGAIHLFAKLINELNHILSLF